MDKGTHALIWTPQNWFIDFNPVSTTTKLLEKKGISPTVSLFLGEYVAVSDNPGLHDRNR